MSQAPTEGGESAVRGSKESPKRLAIYLLAGVLLIYLGTWIGPLAFYFNFQRPLEVALAAGRGAVLWADATSVEGRPAEPWPVANLGLAAVPIPSRASATRADGDQFLVEIDGAVLRFARHDAGFLRDMLRTELETLKVDMTNDVVLEVFSDRFALLAILRENATGYRAGWSKARRQRYAAHLLCKLLLFEDAPVASVLFCDGGAGNRAAAVVRYESGAGTAIVCSADSVWVVTMPQGVPAEWGSLPAGWLAAP